MLLVKGILYLILGVMLNLGIIHHPKEPRATNSNQTTMQVQGDHGGIPVYPDP